MLCGAKLRQGVSSEVLLRYYSIPGSGAHIYCLGFWENFHNFQLTERLDLSVLAHSKWKLLGPQSPKCLPCPFKFQRNVLYKYIKNHRRVPSSERRDEEDIVPARTGIVISGKTVSLRRRYALYDAIAVRSKQNIGAVEELFVDFGLSYVFVDSTINFWVGSKVIMPCNICSTHIRC